MKRRHHGSLTLDADEAPLSSLNAVGNPLTVEENMIKRSKIDYLRSNGSLLRFLDFTSPTLSSDATVSSHFDEIAEHLLRHTRIVCQVPAAKSVDDAEEEYKILELEFYLIKNEFHRDPYAHDHEEQRICGQWYFHRAPRRAPFTASPTTKPRCGASLDRGYRGGTRKGLDITIGTPLVTMPETLITSRYFAPTSSISSTPPPPPTDPASSTTRGGILIRSLRRMSDMKVISGPSLVVDELLRASRASSIAELVRDKWCDDISAFGPTGLHQHAIKSAFLFLRHRPSAETDTAPIVYKSPRIGLDLSNPATRCSSSDPRILYVSRPYRYFLYPHLLTANGRGQTLLGVYQWYRAQTSGSEETQAVAIDELAKLTGIQKLTITKYLGDYRDACAVGDVKAFVGPKGKGASASPSQFLRMMGAIERFLAS
ncbi:hypothetical protein BV25DRAFT_1829053 [Artomyces pyxidatus]|uniref:Uncharacterized protein n=1 Tax=Artomyces pyxidatus TaxID=48021 RepID=A0ACB8STM6_9AGAM|nr:hypothetical protein BV25DRAFT_1829053 [Artomyces pyxidatus]